MKYAALIIFLAALLSCAPQPKERQAAGSPDGSGRLVVDIRGLRNDDGEVFISVFSGAKGFPDDIAAAVVNRRQEIRERQCRIVIPDLPYGEYAVSVLHDENRDGEMNASLLGIPREGFGFSGNPTSRMGPPGYDEARFLFLAPEKQVDIMLRYETVGRERQRIMQERKKP